ncbi:sugar MFS transporter [Qipengyuania atrilutea]|uniref:Sugar MFS transporter n=1 Tax=Qipengyuania atrilutea TaxID=2744473 RepID=A0A850GY11_9SPHN|nr:sugar MFS transporter [Actirhodobacter atriluteus]NVD44494.1 sugar MFS transporter [Actirhodobacter atriluteus]
MVAVPDNRANTSGGGGSSATGAFATITTLFFAWGFITSLIDPLVAAVKGIFSLSNFEAQLTAFAFFIAYGLVSIPAAILVSRIRAVPAIVLAIGLMVGACLAIMAAGSAATYAGVLFGLFVMASGITILQVAANPLAAALGVPEKSHFRLTFSQAFNSLGTVLGPLIGAHFLLEGVEVPEGEAIDAAAASNALSAVNTSFLVIGALLVLLALFIWLSRQRIERASPEMSDPAGFGDTVRAVGKSRWAKIGGLAIFLYVGAEVAIGTQMALFLNDGDIWNIPLQEAGYYVSLYWLGAMIGRFLGSALLTQFKAYNLFGFATAVAALLCAYVAFVGGPSAGYAALCIGLFNSIMFPVIFTLTLERSSASDAATSGFLCVCIIGGAFVPLAVGALADASDYATALLIPMLCYAVLFGISRLARSAELHTSHKTEPAAL